MSEEGRRRHYGAFYGLEDLPESDGPRVYVHGNCQAEALRVLLSTSGRVDSVRVPPVHELTLEDLPHLDRLLGWADVLVAQRVSDGYRGLRLGTDEVRSRMGRGTRWVRVPNYFSTALYPEQVLVRHGDTAVTDPPVVPYHDVRRLAAAAGWRPTGARGGGTALPAGGFPPLPAEGVRQGAALSLAELERREREQRSLRISDVVASAGAAAGWTVDHPGNPVLLTLAQRVVDEVVGAGEARVRDPGRVLLGSVRTPLRAEVIDALALDAEPRTSWLVDAREVSDDEVGQAHREFYAAHPRVVEVGVAKNADVLRRLGWAP